MTIKVLYFSDVRGFMLKNRTIKKRLCVMAASFAIIRI